MSSDVKNEHIKESDYKDYNIPVKTLNDVFKENNVKEIDMLKIDVEGHEYEVLYGNDWDKFRPRIIIIENTFSSKWLSLMKKNEYSEVHYDGLNRYFVRNDLKKIHTLNNYVKVLLSGANIKTANHSYLERQYKLTCDWLLEANEELNKARDANNRLALQIKNIKNNPFKYFGIKKMSLAMLKRIKIKYLVQNK